MSSVQYTKNTGTAIQRAYRMPIFANRRNPAKAPPGITVFNGLWVPTFSGDKEETVKVITLTYCYFGRGHLTWDLGEGDDNVLEGDMPSGLYAYVGVEVDYKTHAGTIITGSTLNSVCDSNFDPTETDIVKMPLWYCERFAALGQWSAVLPLWLTPRIPLRV